MHTACLTFARLESANQYDAAFAFSIVKKGEKTFAKINATAN